VSEPRAHFLAARSVFSSVCHSLFQ
jgi:hypothetical protein